MLAGVIGWPVTHSLSPALHGHWLAEYGIDGAMVPLAARVEDFSAVIEGVRRAGFKGVNVTVPHKEAAFALAHKVDGPAQAAGAANLLLFRKDGILARNTDALGLADSLRESIGTLEAKAWCWWARAVRRAARSCRWKCWVPAKSIFSTATALAPKPSPLPCRNRCGRPLSRQP